jgi:hypothetical protein
MMLPMWDDTLPNLGDGAIRAATDRIAAMCARLPRRAG